MVSAATSPWASGAILEAVATAARQIGSPPEGRLRPSPYSAAKEASPPTTTVAMTRGMRRVADRALRWSSISLGSSISFVIRSQIWLSGAS